MKRKRDFAMLYASLAGFLLFVVLPIGCVSLLVRSSEETHVSSPVSRLLPDGAQIIEERDSHGGFHGDGVSFLSVQIPMKDSAEFVQQLKEKGFTDAPVPEDIRGKLSGDKETCAAANIAHALWWFRDDSPDDVCLFCYTNYTFQIYDLNTGIYYYIEYDS